MLPWLQAIVCTWRQDLESPQTFLAPTQQGLSLVENHGKIQNLEKANFIVSSKDTILRSYFQQQHHHHLLYANGFSLKCQNLEHISPSIPSHLCSMSCLCKRCHNMEHLSPPIPLPYCLNWQFLLTMLQCGAPFTTSTISIFYELIVSPKDITVWSTFYHQYHHYIQS